MSESEAEHDQTLGVNALIWFDGLHDGVATWLPADFGEQHRSVVLLAIANVRALFVDLSTGSTSRAEVRRDLTTHVVRSNDAQVREVAELVFEQFPVLYI